MHLHQSPRLELLDLHERLTLSSCWHSPKNQRFNEYTTLSDTTFIFLTSYKYNVVLEYHTLSPILIAHRMTLSFPQIITSLFSSSTARLRSAKASLS